MKKFFFSLGTGAEIRKDDPGSLKVLYIPF